jgi:hypothetical protein
MGAVEGEALKGTTELGTCLLSRSLSEQYTRCSEFSRVANDTACDLLFLYLVPCLGKLFLSLLIPPSVITRTTLFPFNLTSSRMLIVPFPSFGSSTQLENSNELWFRVV